MVIYSNAAPSDGFVCVTPLNGTALLTNFTVTSSVWADVEGNIPLQYAFYLVRDASSQTRSTLTLRGLATSASYKVSGDTYVYRAWRRLLCRDVTRGVGRL